MEFSKLNGFYLVQNNFLALCKKLLTTLENRLISNYLFGIFLHCSFFIWNKVSAFLYFNKWKQLDEFAFRRTKIRKTGVLQERHNRYIYDSLCYVSDIYTHAHLLIDFKLT